MSKNVRRFLFLMALALLCALAIEIVVFQPQALLPPRHAAQALAQDGPILLLFDETGACTLTWEDLSCETESVGFTLSGATAQVDITVRLKDDANAYTFAEALRGECVPGSETLRAFTGTLLSNGRLHGLQVTFSLPRPAEGEIWLERVELNAGRGGVVIQPLRLGLTFLLLALALGLAFLPWRGLMFDPRRPRHWLALLLPMLALMAVTLFLCVIRLPPSEGDATRGLFQLRDLHSAYNDLEDAYSQLFIALRNGQFCLVDDPTPELLALENPYDLSARDANSIASIFDYALYEGKYYVYFGLAPLLLCYATLYRLTGLLPTPELCALLLSWLAIPLLFLAMLGFLKRFGKRPNLVLLSLSCTTFALVCCSPVLYTLPSRYTNVVLANIAMMAGALGFGLFATTWKRGWARALGFLASGGCFALQSMGRANTLLITTAFLAPAFIGVLCDREASVRQKARDAACFLLPACAGVAFVMFYNYSRFGSVAEFGQTHQLTMEDIHYNAFRASLIPQALAHFLFDPPAFLPFFPFVREQDVFINTTGNYFWRMPNIGVMIWPAVWPLFALPSALRACADDPRALRAQRRLTCALPLLCCLCLMVVSYFYAGLTQRYTYDFLPAFTLLALFAGQCLAVHEPGSLLSRTWQNLFVVLCVLSCLMSLLLLGYYSHDPISIAGTNPEWYVSLIRMFRLP